MENSELKEKSAFDILISEFGDQLYRMGESAFSIKESVCRLGICMPEEKLSEGECKPSPTDVVSRLKDMVSSMKGINNVLEECKKNMNKLC